MQLSDVEGWVGARCPCLDLFPHVRSSPPPNALSLRLKSPRACPAMWPRGGAGAAAIRWDMGRSRRHDCPQDRAMPVGMWNEWECAEETRVPLPPPETLCLPPRPPPTPSPAPPLIQKDTLGTLFRQEGGAARRRWWRSGSMLWSLLHSYLNAPSVLGLWGVHKCDGEKPVAPPALGQRLLPEAVAWRG